MSIHRSGGFAALAAAFALCLTGCVTAGATTQSVSSTIPELAADQKVSIVFESYNLLQAGTWTDTINGLVADFEKAHPNITVKAQPTQGTSAAGTNTAGSVQTQMLAGNPPDVAQLTFDTLDYAVTKIGAKSITALVGKDAVAAHFASEHPFAERATTLGDWNGSTYGIPYVFSTPVMFYNATQTAAAGISGTPDLSTWAKVGEAAKAVTAKTGKPSLAVSCAVAGGNWCMQGVFRSDGARVLSEDRSTIMFGQSEAVDAVTMLQQLYKAGVLVNLDSTAQYQAFMRGDVAFDLNTSALQGTFMASAKSGGWTLSNAAMPAFGSKTAVPTNSGSALFIFSQDQAKQRAAWDFIQFMTSDHAYEQITTKIGYLPLRTSLTEAGQPLYDWAQANPLVKPNLAQLSRLEPWVSYPGNDYVQVDTILAKAIEDSVFNGKDPQTTMADAAARAQKLIEK